jgi:hypothetical protein
VTASFLLPVFQNPDWDRIELELALSAPGHMEAVTIERGGQLI